MMNVPEWPTKAGGMHSLDLSEKIDPALVEIFDAIAKAAAARHIRYFVVGATARDMVLGFGPLPD